MCKSYVSTRSHSAQASGFGGEKSPDSFYLLLRMAALPPLKRHSSDKHSTNGTSEVSPSSGTHHECYGDATKAKDSVLNPLASSFCSSPLSWRSQHLPESFEQFCKKLNGCIPPSELSQSFCRTLVSLLSQSFFWVYNQILWHLDSFLWIVSLFISVTNSSWSYTYWVFRTRDRWIQGKRIEF